MISSPYNTFLQWECIIITVIAFVLFAAIHMMIRTPVTCLCGGSSNVVVAVRYQMIIVTWAHMQACQVHM